jgi:hypothetical protein
VKSRLLETICVKLGMCQKSVDLVVAVNQLILILFAVALTNSKIVLHNIVFVVWNNYAWV